MQHVDVHASIVMRTVSDGCARKYGHVMSWHCALIGLSEAI